MSLLRHRVARRAPAWIRNRIQRWRQKPGRLVAVLKNRNQRRHFQVQQDVVFEVFWKDQPLGQGPAASVFCHGQERLRFDCFGTEKGHYHVAYWCPPGSGENRLYFRERTREQQIERTVFEIQTNLDYYLRRIPDTRVRALQIDKNSLRAGCDWLRQQLLNLLQAAPWQVDGKAD